MNGFSIERARDFCIVNNWSGLLTYAQDCRSIELSNYLCHYYIGIALYELGLSSGAIDAYEKALSLHSRDASVWDNLALAIGKARGFKDAESFHKIAVETNPSHANAHFNYGTLLGQHGRSREAVAMLKIAHTLAPDRIDILSCLIKALDDESDYFAIIGLLPACRLLDPPRTSDLERYLRSKGVRVI